MVDPARCEACSRRCNGVHTFERPSAIRSPRGSREAGIRRDRRMTADGHAGHFGPGKAGRQAIPCEAAMSDDDRERHPLRDQGDSPAEDGIRSDHAGSGAAVGGVDPMPAGTGGRHMGSSSQAGGADKATANPADDPGRSGPLTGQVTGAGGGYGTGSDLGSSGGGSNGSETPDTEGGSQADWLRGAPGSGDEATAPVSPTPGGSEEQEASGG